MRVPRCLVGISAALWLSGIAAMVRQAAWVGLWMIGVVWATLWIAHDVTRVRDGLWYA